MSTQIDKGALPCEAELKAPYTRQASRIDYVNAIAGHLEEHQNISGPVPPKCLFKTGTPPIQIIYC